MIGFRFVMHYLVSFLVLQSSRWERERWLLYSIFLPDVLSLLVSVAPPCGVVGWSECV